MRFLRRYSLVVIVALALSGCRAEIPDLSPISRQAIEDYRDARTIYLEAIASGVKGDDLRLSLQSALELLEGAIDKPPPQPMYLAAKADLLARDSTQPDLVLENAYHDVLRLCPQWIPAYVALAGLAAKRGALGEAATLLDRGEEMLAELEDFQPREWIPPWHPDFWFGLPFYDPTLPEEARHAAIYDQLAASFTWHDGLRQSEDSPVDSVQPIAVALGARLRARLLFERTRIRELVAAAGSDRRENQCRMLYAIDEQVLRIDPEFLEAESLRVELLTELGQYRAAERVLIGLTNPKRTRLSRDARFLGALMRVYLGWLIASRAEVLDDDPANDAVASARVPELDESIGAVFVRLGSIEHIEPAALLDMAEFVVVKSEWLGSDDPDALRLIDHYLLPAARNAVARVDEASLVERVDELEKRNQALRRAALAKRKPTGKDDDR